jgi:hypothetical protein
MNLSYSNRLLFLFYVGSKPLSESSGISRARFNHKDRSGDSYISSLESENRNAKISKKGVLREMSPVLSYIVF